MITAAEVRAASPTEQRIYLMEHGWTKGRNQADWRHPDHGGGHTLAAAVRLAIGTEGR